VELLVRNLSKKLKKAMPKGTHLPEKVSKILKLLEKHGIIDSTAYSLLDGIRDKRDKHVHLKKLSQDRDLLKADSLEVLTDLIHYRGKNPQESS